MLATMAWMPGSSLAGGVQHHRGRDAQPIDFAGCFSRTIVHEPSFVKGLNAFWAAADLDDLKLWPASM